MTTDHPDVAAAAERRLADLVDSCPVAIVTVDADGLVATWNRGATSTFGHDANDVVGRPALALAAGHEHDAFARLLAHAAGGATATERHTVWLTFTGAEVEVALSLSPIPNTDGDIAIVARDITEERWLAATLDRSLDSLRTALDDAREAEAAARRFLADVAHQLRTPVAGIKASAEVLMSGGEVAAEMHDRLLSNIVAETTRAGRLMGSLVRMARLEQGEELVRRPTDVGAVCDSAANTARVLSPHLVFTVDATKVEDARPSVDAHALEEILGNLLDNARRYAGRDIWVSARMADSSLEIRVADDGPGVPPGHEEDVFDRFVRLDSGGGSGLGLAIARTLARAHDGDVTWSGREFVVTLA